MITHATLFQSAAGLAECYSANPQLKRGEELSPEARTAAASPFFVATACMSR
jgi:hypothetical protein